MTDVTKCSHCRTRAARHDHSLCQKCINNAPACAVYLPELTRREGETFPAFLLRYREDAHRGQREMDARCDFVRFGDYCASCGRGGSNA